jgi:hypothetical protein
VELVKGAGSGISENEIHVLYYKFMALELYLSHLPAISGA